MHKQTNTIVNKKEKKRRIESEDFAGGSLLNFDELNGIIKRTNKECSVRQEDKFSCILSNFITESGFPSYDKAITLIQECREVTRCKNAEEKDKFLLEEFRNSITNFHEVLNADDPQDEEQIIDENLAEAELELLKCLPCYNESFGGSLQDFGGEIKTKSKKIKTVKIKKAKFNHVFTIIAKTNYFIPIKVCRMCWSNLFGFSKWKLDQASLKLRETNSTRPNLTKVDIFDDKSYHDFSHKENLNMFKDLGVGQKQGK